jgi:hypothetical protein
MSRIVILGLMAALLVGCGARSGDTEEERRRVEDKRRQVEDAKRRGEDERRRAEDERRRVEDERRRMMDAAQEAQTTAGAPLIQRP